MAKVTLPDGTVKEVGDGTTAEQLAQQIGTGFAKAAVAVKINGKLVDLSTLLTGVGGTRGTETS